MKKPLASSRPLLLLTLSSSLAVSVPTLLPGCSGGGNGSHRRVNQNFIDGTYNATFTDGTTRYYVQFNVANGAIDKDSGLIGTTFPLAGGAEQAAKIAIKGRDKTVVLNQNGTVKIQVEAQQTDSNGTTILTGTATIGKGESKVTAPLETISAGGTTSGGTTSGTTSGSTTSGGTTSGTTTSGSTTSGGTTSGTTTSGSTTSGGTTSGTTSGNTTSGGTTSGTTSGTTTSGGTTSGTTSGTTTSGTTTSGGTTSGTTSGSTTSGGTTSGTTSGSTTSGGTTSGTTTSGTTTSGGTTSGGTTSGTTTSGGTTSGGTTSGTTTSGGTTSGTTTSGGTTSGTTTSGTTSGGTTSGTTTSGGTTSGSTTSGGTTSGGNTSGSTTAGGTTSGGTTSGGNPTLASDYAGTYTGTYGGTSSQNGAPQNDAGTFRLTVGSTRNASNGTVPATATFTRNGASRQVVGTVNDSGQFFADASGLTVDALGLVLVGLPNGSLTGTITRDAGTQTFRLSGQYNYSYGVGLLPPIVTVAVVNSGTFTATR